MKRGPKKATPVTTTELCGYGCGKVARYENSSGKLICDTHSNKCPEIRKKNSYGVANSGRDYKADYDNLSQEIKDKMASSNRGNFTNVKSVIIQQRGHKCEMCSLDEWLGNKIKLELDHIDGDNTNNDDTNLRLLCPNCHSTTPTWRTKKNPKILRQKYSDQEMIEAIESSTSMNACLRKLNLSWGSGETILKCMMKYNKVFLGS